MSWDTIAGRLIQQVSASYVIIQQSQHCNYASSHVTLPDDNRRLSCLIFPARAHMDM